MLWFRNQGVGGPDYTTLRITRVDGGGLALYVGVAGKSSCDSVVLKDENIDVLIDKLMEYRKRTAGFKALKTWGGEL